MNKPQVLDDKVHGIIDYIVVAFLWAAPSFIEFTPYVAKLVYGLGAVHLTLTVLTKFPYGIIKVIPLSIHGYVELIVSIFLVISPWILGFSDDANGKIFFIVFGIVVFITWYLSAYQPANSE